MSRHKPVRYTTTTIGARRRASRMEAIRKISQAPRRG